MVVNPAPLLNNVGRRAQRNQIRQAAQLLLMTMRCVSQAGLLLRKLLLPLQQPQLRQPHALLIRNCCSSCGCCKGVEVYQDHVAKSRTLM